MKIRLASFLTLVAVVGLGFTMVSFTASSNEVTATEISTDGDCDKCKDPKCDGKCDQEHKCTEECKKDGKCTHKAEASKTEPATKKACCAKKGENASKSCKPKKECNKK